MKTLNNVYSFDEFKEKYPHATIGQYFYDLGVFLYTQHSYPDRQSSDIISQMFMKEMLGSVVVKNENDPITTVIYKPTSACCGGGEVR